MRKKNKKKTMSVRIDENVLKEVAKIIEKKSLYFCDYVEKALRELNEKEK